MLRPPTLVSSTDHLRPLIPNPFKLRRLNSTNPALVAGSIQNPRLRALLAPNFRARAPRTGRLFCRPDHSDDAVSLSQAPAVDAKAEGEADAKAEGEAEWARSDWVEGAGLSVGVGNPSLPVSLRMHRMSLGDQAFFLLAFIACTTSVAFTGLVIAAVPTLYAMKKAATSFARLADTARDELPSTMAAIRLSGMEISDLTLELSDLSQEIADGVNKSAQAVQAAEAGIRQIGALARSQTMSMIHERASLPNISLQPVVAGAAKKTSRVVGQATKNFMNLISRGEYSSENNKQGSD